MVQHNDIQLLIDQLAYMFGRLLYLVAYNLTLKCQATLHSHSDLSYCQRMPRA